MNLEQIHPPLVSIILPTYNVGAYIERCLLSCTTQTLTNIEILVVDDCGSDNSIKIAEELSRKDQRIKIVRNPHNMGTLLARKSGTQSAKGEYVIFLDPDDCISPETAEELYIEAKKESAEIVFFGVKKIPSPRFYNTKPSLPQKKGQHKSPLRQVFYASKNPSWGTAGTMYLRTLSDKTFKKLEFIKQRTTYAEDVLFLFTATSLARSFISVRKEFYIYYKNPESITEKNDSATLSYRDSQLNLVIDLIKKLSHDKELISINSDILALSAEKAIKHLISEIEHGRRHAIDPETGKSIYFKSVVSSYKAKPRLSTLIRLTIYCLTFKRIKI